MQLAQVIAGLWLGVSAVPVPAELSAYLACDQMSVGPFTGQGLVGQFGKEFDVPLNAVPYSSDEPNACMKDVLQPVSFQNWQRQNWGQPTN